ncbi:MAG: FAD-dependent oxidoreductase [Verrucomicrobiales bacterium]|nr:FAD-dependent oxidoreductase [Verrucomicrobiales bacterium]
MNRRGFLTATGLGTGYALMARVDAAETDPRAALDPQFDRIAPATVPAHEAGAEPHMTLVELGCDVMIAGGGMAGVCAALAAARNGASVILVQDRSRLGGNASSEVKMHIVGANCHGGRPGWREGGILEELRLDDAVNNPHRSWEMWDLLLYDKIKSEPRITLLLDSVLYSVTARDGLIERVMVRCDKTEHLYRIQARQYLDCTGDCRLGIEAGADYRVGRESKAEFGEPLAVEVADRHTLGSSILFTARDHGRPIPYTPPTWAKKITREQLYARPIDSWEYGYWWIEWGGNRDPIRDNERIRFELLSIVLGIWDHIKNSGHYPSSANWGLETVGMIPGKRGSRRLLGDHILTQMDLEGKTGEFQDAVSIGGWNLDDHPPGGFSDSHLKPFTSIRLPDVYNIPLRALYSRNVRNLFMAGRNLSATHVAFTSTRVMATCACAGQAAGTAAALCVRHGLLPRELANHAERLAELQQTLLRDDQTIKGLRARDDLDLARSAKVTYSWVAEESDPESILDGYTRNVPGGADHRWTASMGAESPWIELTWDVPREIRRVQITFDSGFHRELTLSSQNAVSRRMIRAPQPETVRDYQVLVIDEAGSQQCVARMEGNHQRLRRHEFPMVRAKSLRLLITATNGADAAHVFEIRCYA